MAVADDPTDPADPRTANILAYSKENFDIHPTTQSVHHQMSALAPVAGFSFPQMLLGTSDERKRNRNLGSVVYELIVGIVNAVFGADLELDTDWGWEAIVRSEINPKDSARDQNRPKTSLMKVSHHGSGGYCGEFFDTRCESDMIAIITSPEWS